MGKEYQQQWAVQADIVVGLFMTGGLKIGHDQEFGIFNPNLSTLQLPKFLRVSQHRIWSYRQRAGSCLASEAVFVLQAWDNLRKILPEASNFAAMPIPNCTNPWFKNMFELVCF